MKQNRRNFIRTTVAASLAAGSIPQAFSKEENKPVKTSAPNIEWRNKNENMYYSQLGRTGLMVSQMVMGAGLGQNMTLGNIALDAGINYFDTAPRYGSGKSEQGVGKLAAIGNNRERMFIATKLSSYLPYLDDLCLEILNGLPTNKQEQIRKQAAEILEYRGARRPGYHYRYFAYHDQELPDGYLTYAILKEHGYQKKWRPLIKQKIVDEVEGSLKRLGTDYIDILHGPHGARLPEELEEEILIESFEELKKAGKIRFTGLSIHSDVAEVLTKAAEVGHYDMAMPAYNILNHMAMDAALYKANEQGMGIIAMKVARAVYSKFRDPIPDWRVAKMNAAIPGDDKVQLKAYTWALQNKSVNAVITAASNKEMLAENITVLGKSVDLPTI